MVHHSKKFGRIRTTSRARHPVLGTVSPQSFLVLVGRLFIATRCTGGRVFGAFVVIAPRGPLGLRAIPTLLEAGSLPLSFAGGRIGIVPSLILVGP